MIDFESGESHLLLNPRLPEADRSRLKKLAEAGHFPGHVYIASSGTTGAVKLVALSKEAILASAAAVNERLDITRDDVWCAVLPPFHVGGLGIFARSYLSGARIVKMAWNAGDFVTACADERVTVVSLVPAQVHDLLAGGYAPPPTLRSILVGGGAFSRELDERSRARGWPVLGSYGMTECCSTIAVATHDGSAFELLGHVEARSESDGRLSFKGPSLLTAYITDDESGRPAVIDPKVDGWFRSEDIGSVAGRVLTVEGRRGDFVKIGGESVDLKRLDAILESINRELGTDAAVVVVPDERLGAVIHLAVASGEPDRIAAAFNDAVLPFERARGIHPVQSIPRTVLGKLMRAELLRLVQVARR